MICYESAFSELSSSFVDKNTQFLSCSANEVWYKNTIGGEQGLLMCKVLAVSLQKPILRSSDFGTSAIIDRKGNIIKKLNSCEINSLSFEIEINQNITFYAKNGNLIGKLAIISLVLILIYYILYFILLNRNK